MSLITRFARSGEPGLLRLCLSMRVPGWLPAAMDRRGWSGPFATAAHNAHEAAERGEKARAERWAAVANAIARAVAHDARDEEIEPEAPPPWCGDPKGCVANGGAAHCDDCRPTDVGVGPSSDGFPPAQAVRS